MNKQKKKAPLMKTSLLIVSVIFIVVVATLAWFITGPTATIDQLDVNVGSAMYIQISGDQGNNWSEDLEIKFGVNKNFKEISGNGKNFYAPVYDVVGNDTVGYSTQLVSFDLLTDENSGEYYYEEILDFRGDAVQDIYLAPESYVAAVGETFIHGAVRVAFIEVNADGTETVRCIWAPNSTVAYPDALAAPEDPETSEGTDVSEDTEGSEDTTLSLVEPRYYYQLSKYPVDPSFLEASTTDIAIIETGYQDSGFDAKHKFMWSTWQEESQLHNLPANAPKLLTLNEIRNDDVNNDSAEVGAEINNDGLFYKQLKVRVWLEGYDRECVSLVSGHRFTIKLQFVAKEVG